MKKGAKFSECRKYRYSLWRIWDESKGIVMFIGLNPSTADENEDDPTIRRCIKFAESWGYGGIVMCNLFAFKATQPENMKKTALPIGFDNDKHLIDWNVFAQKTIAAWGNDGSYLRRSEEIKRMLSLHYLKLNKSGEPAHPLYLKGDLKPILWEY